MMGGAMYSGMRRLNHLSPMFPSFVHPFARMAQMFNPTATILLPGQLPIMIPLSNLPIKIELRAPRTTFDEFPDVPDDKDDTIDPAEGNTNDMGPPSFSEKPPSFSEMPPSFLRSNLHRKLRRSLYQTLPTRQREKQSRKKPIQQSPKWKHPQIQRLRHQQARKCLQVLVVR